MGDSTTKTRVPTIQPPDDRTTEPGPTVEWAYYPTLQRRRLALAVVGLLLAVGLLVAWITGKWYLGAMTSLAGFVSVWRLYVPMRFELSNQGITQTAWHRRSTTDWRSVGKIELLDDGLRLLPVPRYGELDVLRAIFVPWGTRRDEVLKCVEFHAPYLLPDDGIEHGARGMVKEQSEKPGGSSTATESRDD